MRFSKLTKRVLSLAMTVAVVASSVAVAPTPKAEAASYKAYLCLMTKKYNYRTNHNDTAKFKNYLQTEKDEKIAGTKFKDVTIKKSKKSATYTVSLTGLKASTIAKDGGWNTLYIDTSIPGTMKNKIKVTKAVVKFDGKTVKTIKNPTVTPDPGASADFTQIMCLNTWNSYSEKKWSAAKVTKMPKKSISVSFTMKFK